MDDEHSSLWNAKRKKRNLKPYFRLLLRHCLIKKTPHRSPSQDLQHDNCCDDNHFKPIASNGAAFPEVVFSWQPINKEPSQKKVGTTHHLCHDFGFYEATSSAKGMTGTSYTGDSKRMYKKIFCTSKHTNRLRKKKPQPHRRSLDEQIQASFGFENEMEKFPTIENLMLIASRDAQTSCTSKEHYFTYPSYSQGAPWKNFHCTTAKHRHRRRYVSKFPFCTIDFCRLKRTGLRQRRPLASNAADQHKSFSHSDQASPNLKLFWKLMTNKMKPQPVTHPQR